MRDKKIAKQLKEFVELTPKLEPAEFLGLSKMLCTPLVDEKKKALPFEEVFENMMDRFCTCNPKARKAILKVMRAAVKEENK